METVQEFNSTAVWSLGHRIIHTSLDIFYLGQQEPFWIHNKTFLVFNRYLISINSYMLHQVNS